MRIFDVRLENWMAFKGVQNVENIPALPIAIVGRYGANERRSNWSGKTAFLEAIMWALYGKHRKRSEDALVHHGERVMSVEIVFDTWTVKRTHPFGKTSTLRVTEVLASSFHEGAAADDFIAKAVGMDADDLLATVVFAQGDIEGLVGMRSGERRKVISRWLELEKWDRAGAKARASLTDATTRLDVLQATARASSNTQTRDQIRYERAQLQAESDRLAAAVLEGEEATTIMRTIENLAQSTPALIRATADGQRARQALNEIGPAIAADVLATMRAEETRLAGELGVAKRRMDELGEIIEHGFDGQCPVMGEPCPAHLQVGASIDQHTHLATEARDAYEKLVQLHRSAHAALVAEGRKAQDRARAVADFDAAKKRYKEVHAQSEALAELLRKHDVPALEARVKASADATEKRNELAGRIRFLEHMEREAIALEEREANRLKEVAAVTREVKIRGAVARALGPTGIVQRIAAEQLGALEERSNALLAGTGLSFSFGWERETKEPAPMCYECGHMFKTKTGKECPKCAIPRGRKRSDELEILVDDGSGDVEDVRAKSGGARVLVGSAIRLAGGAMLRDVRSSTVAWAIVDEPFGPLDAENREALARTFAGMLSSVGLEQAFVVSHDAALLEALPARIVVHRDGNSSRATLEV
jgi:DNA repair exonuclease SbcCD ATPase subunit